MANSFRGPLVLAALACATLSTSCALIPVDPVVAEERPVTPVTDEDRTITLNVPVVWMNGPAHRATRGIRLPQGVYRLEAENADFLYFRAPEPIELRAFDPGEAGNAEGEFLPGGLAMSRQVIDAVGAITYVDVDPEKKMHIMKLGHEFMTMRGKEWEKDF